jgi:hypothetical protein
MRIASSSADALASRLSSIPEDAVERMQAIAQVSALRKVREVESDMVRTLIDGVGSRLDVRA